MRIILFVRSIAVLQVALALRVLPQDQSDHVIDRRVAKNMKDFDTSKILLESLKKNLQIQNKYKQKHGGSVNILRIYEATTSRSAAKPLKGEDVVEALREENELKGINVDSSALLDRPYMQQKGRHDFLVMHSDNVDDFVTVVPNSIYYNVEKPCVNWLDSCSIQGIRAHLLQKVRSPYK